MDSFDFIHVISTIIFYNVLLTYLLNLRLLQYLRLKLGKPLYMHSDYKTVRRRNVFKRPKILCTAKRIFFLQIFKIKSVLLIIYFLYFIIINSKNCKVIYIFNLNLFILNVLQLKIIGKYKNFRIRYMCI